MGYCVCMTTRVCVLYLEVKLILLIRFPSFRDVQLIALHLSTIIFEAPRITLGIALI